MSCGTTNVGHYAFIQQGINSSATAKDIYEALIKFAPATPNEGWELIAIELKDYKSWHNKKFYHIHATYKFRKKHQTYSNQVNISPEDIKEIYDMFRKGMGE